MPTPWRLIDRNGYIAATILQAIALSSSVGPLEHIDADPARAVIRIAAWWCVASVPMCLITAKEAQTRKLANGWIFAGLLSLPGLLLLKSMSSPSPPTAERREGAFHADRMTKD